MAFAGDIEDVALFAWHVHHEHIVGLVLIVHVHPILRFVRTHVS
jgi:hypothetical protein